VKSVAREARRRGFGDLATPGSEVCFGDAGHDPNVKRTFVLDNLRNSAHAEFLSENHVEEYEMARSVPQTIRATGLVIGVVAVQALFLTLFAWPAVNTEPRDLPIVVAGPAPAADAVAQQLEEARPGAFDVDTVADAAAADDAIRDRKAYGAFVVTPSPNGPPTLEVHVASAASPVLAQLLTQIAQTAGQESGQTQPTKVVDVVPADKDDPRGAGLDAGVLPLIMTSIVVGMLLTFVIGGRIARFVGVILYAALAGLAATWILQYGLHAISGDYLQNAQVVALIALAMGGAIAGLGALLGVAGAVIGAVVVFLLGNPLSGITSAPEMLPQPWGEVGQWLPPGAGGTLLRSVVFFDGAGGTLPMWILASWSALALLTLVGRAGGPRTAAEPAESAVADQPEPAAAA
jgi:multisubunit Na+/H+ antiporter MnhC subunit